MAMTTIITMLCCIIRDNGREGERSVYSNINFERRVPLGVRAHSLLNSWVSLLVVTAMNKDS